MNPDPLLAVVFDATMLPEIEVELLPEIKRVPFTAAERMRIQWGLPIGNMFLLLTSLQDFGMSEESVPIMNAFSARLKNPAVPVRVGDLIVSKQELAHVRATGIVRPSLFKGVAACTVDSNRLLDAVIDFRFKSLSMGTTVAKRDRLGFDVEDRDRYRSFSYCTMLAAMGYVPTDETPYVVYLTGLSSRVQCRLDERLNGFRSQP